MTLSLREQLMKAGLVTQEQVQKVERDKNRQQFTAPRSRKQPPKLTAYEIAAQKAAAEKVARDAELNRKKQEKLERRAKFAQIKQLVEQNHVPRVETEDFYNFQDGAKIRRVPVTPELRSRLVSGQLAIVRCEGRYAFVPPEIGEQVRIRIERALIHLNKPSAAPDANDPYKDYVVPDDLVW
jgi:uncharacterized protein